MIHKLILGTEKPEPEAFQQMQDRGGKWAAYQSMDMSSATLGDLRFLQVGAGRTFEVAPDRYPDTQFGIGWRFLFVGFVNLESGEIENAADV